MKKVLLVDVKGVKIRLEGERLVYLSRGRVEQVPLKELGELRLSEGVSITSDALVSLGKRGVLVSIVDDMGRPVSVLVPAASGGTVRTRREQLMAYYDERGVHIARSLVYSAVAFRANLVRSLHRNRPELLKLEDYAKEMEEIALKVREVSGPSVDSVRSELMNLEGRASSAYFTALSEVLPEEMFSGRRSRRPPEDGFNAALSYGNSMVYSEALKCVIFSGLDPFAGFLHVDRPGRYSMALDLAEEFLVEASHRPVINLVVRKVLKPSDLRREGGSVYLNYEGRGKVSRAVYKALNRYVRYEGKRWKLKDLILLRARRLVTYLRGESDYPELVPWK